MEDTVQIWAIGKSGSPGAIDYLLSHFHPEEYLTSADDKKEFDDVWEGDLIMAHLFGEFKEPRAVDPLLIALKASNYFLKAIAAWSLGEIGDPRALEPLKEELEDDEYDFWWSAGLYFQDQYEDDDEPMLYAIMQPLERIILPKEKSSIELAIEKIEARENPSPA